MKHVKCNAIVLALLLGLLITGISCTKTVYVMTTPSPTPPLVITPAPADEHYREQEAIMAVHSYLYSLAKGPAANNYVRSLIWGVYADYDDLSWRAWYNPSAKEWNVELYRKEPSGLEVVCAWWIVYPEDMSKINPREWDATKIKGEIEELSKGY